MNDDIDIDMLNRIAKNAAYKVTTADTRTHQDDLHQDLLMFVLENRERFDRYILRTSELGKQERENKLFIALRRVGKTFAQEVINDLREYRVSMLPGMEVYSDIDEENWPNEDAPTSTATHVHTYRQMTPEDVNDFLPYVYQEDTEIPEALLERVAILRNGILTCTPEQQQVIALVAKGMAFKEIDKALNLGRTTAIKRWKRAALPERCDFPEYVFKSERAAS